MADNAVDIMEVMGHAISWGGGDPLGAEEQLGELVLGFRPPALSLAFASKELVCSSARGREVPEPRGGDRKGLGDTG